MDVWVVAVFLFVYLGMVLGEIPGLALDPVPFLLASTLAGNLFIVGSIANIIVIEQARALGIRIGWREHARVGVPVTAATLLIAALWLAVRAG